MSQDLANFLPSAPVVFVPAIATVATVFVLIKQVHIAVQITEELAQLQTVALRSDESVCVSIMIKPSVLIRLVEVTLSSLPVAASTLRETRSHGLELIVVDAKSASRSQL